MTSLHVSSHTETEKHEINHHAVTSLNKRTFAQSEKKRIPTMNISSFLTNKYISKLEIRTSFS
jgi:hypothetical protein